MRNYNNGHGVRREDRIKPKMARTHHIFTPSQYHEIAHKLKENNISYDILFPILKQLISHHAYQKKNNPDDEFIIYTQLCKLYNFGVPIELFTLIAKNIYLIILSLLRSDSLQKLESLRLFITQLILLLQSGSLETEHSQNVLCMLSQVTALSSNLTSHCIEQLSISFIFDIILYSKNNSSHASNILANIILGTDHEFPLDSFLIFIDKLIQMKRLKELPNVLLCIQKMIKESREYESIMDFFLMKERVLFFNELLFADSEGVINGVLLIFKKLLSFKILFFLNFGRIFELTLYSKDISVLSIKVTAKYVKIFPDKVDELCNFFDMLTLLSNIISNGSVNEKVEILDVFMAVLTFASEETQKRLLMMSFVGSLLELTSILNADDIEMVFVLFQKMMDTASKLNINNILKNAFSEKSNFEILEAISGRGGRISEIADVFLAFIELDE